MGGVLSHISRPVLPVDARASSPLDDAAGASGTAIPPHHKAAAPVATSKDFPVAEFVQSLDDMLAIVDWEDYRTAKGIRGGGGSVIWFKTSGPFSVENAPPRLQPDVDDIYMHHDTSKARYKIWVANKQRVWVHSRPGDVQPSNESKRLSVSKFGDPSWVTKASWTVYCSRNKKALRLNGHSHGPSVGELSDSRALS